MLRPYESINRMSRLNEKVNVVGIKDVSNVTTHGFPHSYGNRV